MGIVILPVLRLLAWIYGVLPRRAQLGAGRGLGAVLRLVQVRAAVIRENLDRAFGGDTERKRALFVEAYTHLGQLSLEVLLLLAPRTFCRFVRQESELAGLEHWILAKERGRGVIFVASHVGNWEVMAASGAQLGQIDIMLVTKHLKPEWLHRAIESGRKHCGVSATYEPKTFRDVLSRLKANGTVGFVLDQYAGPPIGIRVPVFGQPVGTHSAVALLAKRTGAAVLPVVNYRDARGRFRTEISPAVTWQEFPERDPQYEVAANTAALASRLEKDIYAHPEQWLWIHRRFKGDLSPLGPEEWSGARKRR